MQTSDNMFTAHDVHFHDTLAATRGRSNHYFSFATWPMGVGTPRWLCVCVCVEYLQQTSWRKGTVLPGRDTVTFIRLNVTEIPMLFIRLSIKLHGGEI